MAGLRLQPSQRWPAEGARGGRSVPGKEDADEVLQRARPAGRQVRGEFRFGSPSHGIQEPAERSNDRHGIPSPAANRIGAPDLTLIYEAGTIGAKPLTPPRSGDGTLAGAAIGTAQIDRFANPTATVIGRYQSSVRLPGASGVLEIAACCQEVIVQMRHSACVSRFRISTLIRSYTADHNVDRAEGVGGGYASQDIAYTACDR